MIGFYRKCRSVLQLAFTLNQTLAAGECVGAGLNAHLLEHISNDGTTSHQQMSL